MFIILSLILLSIFAAGGNTFLLKHFEMWNIRQRFDSRAQIKKLFYSENKNY